MNRNYLIDIGASNIRFGVASDAISEPIIVEKTPTQKGQILSLLKDGFQQLQSSINVDNYSLVVSCPGMIDERGTVKEAYYIDLTDVSLFNFFKELSPKLNRIVIDNDANIHALGCYNGINLLYIGLGSAVGGAYVDRHGVFKGQHGFACEFGHIPVINKCNGQISMDKLDDIISGLSLEKKLGTLWWEKVQNNDIVNYLEIAGKSLAKVIDSLTFIFDPGEVCICGHLCNMPFFCNAVVDYLSYNNDFSDNCNLSFRTNTWELVNKACFTLL